jgi:hypothetical protein
MGEKKIAYKILVGRPVGKTSLGKYRNRRDDVKMDHKKIELDDNGLDSSGLG